MERPNWKMVTRLTDAELEAAFSYCCRRSTESQDALAAAQCVALVIENRRALRQGEEAR